MPESDQWSDDQVLEALQGGVNADRADTEQATQSQGIPEGNVATPAEGQAVTPEAPAAQNPDLFEGTPINPDELPAEMQPLARQLQAAFTQKTQDLAEQRRQFEALGAVEEVQQAVDLYARITDPSNWAQLHQELTTAMQQAGMTPAQANAAAAEVVEAAQVPAPSLDDIDDPDLAPLAQMLKQQQAELDLLKTEREYEQANQQAEYQRQAFLGELQRQENAIRAAHPEWDDEKIEAVYEMSSFHQGNLGAAAARLEGLLSRERELYLNQKAGALQETGAHPAPRGAGLDSQREQQPLSIRDVEESALEFLNARANDA